MKGSKWTWLRDKCIKLGYNESAKLAQEIEDVLYRLYGITNTKAWIDAKEKEIAENFIKDPNDIVTNPDFCCACVDVRELPLCCSKCIFGRETGICDVDGSLYLNFYKMFQMEHSKK